MHRQGRSPKGFGLFVLMGRAAEGRGTVAMRPFVRFRPAAGREGIPFFSRDPLHGPEPLRSLGRALGACVSVHGLAAGDGRHGRSGRAPGDREQDPGRGGCRLGYGQRKLQKIMVQRWAGKQ